MAYAAVDKTASNRFVKKSYCRLPARFPAACRRPQGRRLFCAGGARRFLRLFAYFLTKKRVPAAKRRAILSLYASPPNGGAKSKVHSFPRICQPARPLANRMANRGANRIKRSRTNWKTICISKPCWPTPRRWTAAASPPVTGAIYQTSSFINNGKTPYSYTRCDNPTRSALEEKCACSTAACARSRSQAGWPQ